jgi:hypothetical protein
MISNLTFERFKELPTIKDLPLNEQQRQYFIYTSDNRYKNASGVTGFSVSVYNQLVTGSIVVIGWVDGLTYTDIDGNIITLSTDEEKGISVATTDEYGVANFSRFNNKWIVIDYSSGEPVKKYAPMYSYGGETDGYTPLNMASNVSIRGINPLTTELITATPNADIKTDPSVDQNLTYLGEWLGSTLTQEQKDLVRQGIAIPEIYQPLIEPIKQASNLFQGLGITSSNVEVEVVSGYTVVYDQKTIAAQTIAPASAFSRYATLRSLLATQSQTKSTFLQNNPVSAEEVGKVLGFNIESNVPQAQMVASLFNKASSVATYQSIKTTYAASFYQKGTRNETSVNALMNINLANRTTGAIQIHADAEIPSLNLTLSVYIPSVNLSVFTSRTEQIRIRRQRTAEGATFDPTTNTILEQNREYSVSLTYDGTSATGGYLYSFNLVTVSGSIRDESVYYVTGEMKDNNIQSSSKIKSPKGSTSFVDVISGNLIKAEPERDLPTTLILLTGIYVDTDITFELQSGEVGRKGWYRAVDPAGRKETIYWSGETWVMDLDIDPREVVATAISPNQPDGTYLDYKGNQLRVILPRG